MTTVEKDLIAENCEAFEDELKSKGGLDFLILGLGSKGNIGFNMPGSSLHSRTRLVMLDGDSRKDIARNFGSLDKVPVSAITIGLSDILDAKKLPCLHGANKKQRVSEILWKVR